MEVEERLVPQMEVRAVVGATGYVDEPIDGAKSIDDLRVCHPAFVFNLASVALRQRWTRPGTAMPIGLIIATRHRMISR
jgi:hypothetical protein